MTVRELVERLEDYRPLERVKLWKNGSLVEVEILQPIEGGVVLEEKEREK